MHVVFAALAILQDHRQLGQVHVAFLQIIFAGHGAQIGDLDVLGQRHHHAVDIGQLVALGVDHVIERVAFHRPDRRVDRADSLPRPQRRQFGVELPVLADMQHANPVVVAGSAGLGVHLGLGRVFRHELLEVMGRGVGAKTVAAGLAHCLAAADQRVAGDHRGEQEIRVLELELDRDLVDLDQLALFAAGRHVGDRVRHDVLVEVHVLIPEHEIIGGEGRAVAPFHAAAEVQGGGLAVGAELISLGDGGHDLAAGRVPEQQLVAGHDAVAVLAIGRADEGAAPGTAVLAGGVERLQHQRFCRQALGHRRQLACLDQFGELRCFLEAGRDGGDLGRTLQLADQARLVERALGGHRLGQCVHGGCGERGAGAKESPAGGHVGCLRALLGPWPR